MLVKKKNTHWKHKYYKVPSKALKRMNTGISINNDSSSIQLLPRSPLWSENKLPRFYSVNMGKESTLVYWERKWLYNPRQDKRDCTFHSTLWYIPIVTLLLHCKYLCLPSALDCKLLERLHFLHFSPRTKTSICSTYNTFKKCLI